MRLDQLPLRQPASVDSIHWPSLSDVEGQRLRELGVSEGVTVEALHHGGLFGRGPIACRVGRMIVAMRRLHAAAITVRPLDHSNFDRSEAAA
ncbi:FeoA family protein [Rhizorhapis sp.]|uniref:FeoA family protein n=1 Tax=Rhizorhapis sp. TaxID=1968842 RepID=UPI002B491174|nr:FeoA family protein [Rhizorhapis sp.]HKR16567.1 FeoA family protein [Rhizorhapis sp.]HKX35378.1 FeoA family protein [Rhizorhapis sp.]